MLTVSLGKYMQVYSVHFMAKVNAIKNGFFQKCSHFTHADGLNMQKYNKFNAVE